MRSRFIPLVLAMSVFGDGAGALAQGAGPREPFKLGTFERSGQTFVGVVLKDTQVIDLAAASAALEGKTPALAKLQMPSDMKDLISRYDSELRPRIYAVVNEVAGASSAPAYVYALKDLRVLPPVRPSIILNAGGNYQEHTQGIAQQQARAGGGAPAPQARRRSPRPASGSARQATRETIPTCSSSHRRWSSAPSIRSACHAGAIASTSSANSTW